MEDDTFFVHRQEEKIHLMEKLLINMKKKPTGKHLEYGVSLKYHEVFGSLNQASV